MSDHFNFRDRNLMKFVENYFVNSIDTIKNFGQTMITLVSGLFAVYFALLEFLGIKSILDNGTQALKDVVPLLPDLFYY